MRAATSAWDSPSSRRNDMQLPRDGVPALGHLAETGEDGGMTALAHDGPIISHLI